MLRPTDASAATSSMRPLNDTNDERSMVFTIGNPFPVASGQWFEAGPATPSGLCECKPCTYVPNSLEYSGLTLIPLRNLCQRLAVSWAGTLHCTVRKTGAR